MASIIDILKEILGNFTKSSGAQAIFMIDLSDASVQISYPEKESKSLEFIAAITATTIVSYESGIKAMGDEKSILEQMEVSTQDKKVFTLKISDQFALCIVGSIDELKVGFVRTMFEKTYKSKIESAMKEAGMM